jgi:hypothetical protein
VANLRAGRSKEIGAQYEAFWAEISRIQDGNQSAVESTLRFLEADPWWVGSGYDKDWIIRALLATEMRGGCSSA